MALNPEVIRTIIFDLDDTLFDTNGQLVQIAAKEACQAMIYAGLKATIDECLNQRALFLAKRNRSDIFEQLTAHFGVSQHDVKTIAAIGSNRFHQREIKEDISLFPETLDVLGELQEIYDLYLVTLGSLPTQQKKIELLKLKDQFLKIFYVDFKVDRTKTAAFKEIMALHPNLSASSFLCVGNRIDGEIRDAKSLGMQTVLMAHGEYLTLEPENDLEKADDKVHSLKDLMDLL